MHIYIIYDFWVNTLSVKLFLNEPVQICLYANGFKYCYLLFVHS